CGPAVAGTHLVGLERHDQIAAVVGQRAERGSDAGDDRLVIARAERVLGAGRGDACHGFRSSGNVRGESQYPATGGGPATCAAGPPSSVYWQVAAATVAVEVWVRPSAASP